jgi:hypothetical protein
MYAMVNAWCRGSYASEMGGLIVCLAQRKTKIAALLIAENQRQNSWILIEASL